jgi:hypothetical protein
MITPNLFFSEWDQIFKEPPTIAAALNRVVHRSIVTEIGKGIPSALLTKNLRLW